MEIIHDVEVRRSGGKNESERQLAHISTAELFDEPGRGLRPDGYLYGGYARDMRGSDGKRLRSFIGAHIERNPWSKLSLEDIEARLQTAGVRFQRIRVGDFFHAENPDFQFIVAACAPIAALEALEAIAD